MDRGVGDELFELPGELAVAGVLYYVSFAVIMLLMLPQVTCCVGHILAVMATVAFFGVGGGVLDAYTLDLLGDRRRGGGVLAVR